MGWLVHAQEPAAIVVVAHPLPHDASYFEFPGRLLPAQPHQLRAPISGTVAKVLVEAGAKVKAGELLVEIDASSLRKKLSEAEAEVQHLDTQHRQLERTLELTKKAGKPPEDLARLAAECDLAGVRRRIAQAEVDRLRRDLELAAVKSPIAGQVDAVLVKPGDTVLAGVRFATHLATVSNGDAVEVSFRLDRPAVLATRAALRQEKTETTATRAWVKLDDETGYSRPSQVAYADTAADAKIGEATCAAIIPDADGSLRRQLALPERQRRRVMVRIAIGPSRPMVRIVESAVMTTAEGEKHVLRLVEGKRVDVRPVKLGPLQDGMQTVESGLTVDDWVVIGVPRPKDDPKRALAASDFASDLRLLRVRPGMIVERVEVAMPGKSR